MNTVVQSEGFTPPPGYYFNLHEIFQDSGYVFVRPLNVGKTHGTWSHPRR